MVRHLEHGSGAHGDHGDTVYTTSIFDICEDCEAVRRETGVIPWPLTELNDLFDDFEAARMGREKFDEGIRAMLRRAGADLRDIA